MKKNSSHVYCLIFFSLFIGLISCEKEVYTGPTEPEPIPQNSVLKIDSYPPSTKIYIEGRNSGYKTPGEIDWLTEGTTKVKLRKEFFADTTFQVALKDQETTSVFIDYRLNPNQYGGIYFGTTPPGAKVYLNDSLIGNSPITIKHVWPGIYKVLFDHVDCRLFRNSVSVYAGIVTDQLIKLEDTTKWISYTSENADLPYNIVHGISADTKNRIWAATSNGLGFFTGRIWKTYNSTNTPFPKDFVRCVNADSKGITWVGTQFGLFTFVNDTWLDQTANLPDPYVVTIHEDYSGNIWIATLNGLVKYNGTSWKLFNTQNSGISSNFIFAIASTKSGVMWFGTGANGICVFDGTNWTQWNMGNMKVNVMIGNIIDDIEVDAKGNVWVAHNKFLEAGREGGFTKYDGTKWTQVFLKGIPDDEITSIFVDELDRKWIGTSQGLGYFYEIPDLKIFNSYVTPLVSNFIRAIEKDKDGNMWIGTIGGISKIKKGNF